MALGTPDRLTGTFAIIGGSSVNVFLNVCLQLKTIPKFSSFSRHKMLPWAVAHVAHLRNCLCKSLLVKIFSGTFLWLVGAVGLQSDHQYILLERTKPITSDTHLRMRVTCFVDLLVMSTKPYLVPMIQKHFLLLEWSLVGCIHIFFQLCKN